MKWTTEKPTEPGWYWKRYPKIMGNKDTIIQLRIYGGKMCESNWEIGDNYEWSDTRIPEPE